MEEERRLAYVGITRAMEDLTLTSARSRMMRGEVQYNPVSRFLGEIPDDLIDEGTQLQSSSRRGISFTDMDDDIPFGYAGGFQRPDSGLLSSLRPGKNTEAGGLSTDKNRTGRKLSDSLQAAGISLGRDFFAGHKALSENSRVTDPGHQDGQASAVPAGQRRRPKAVYNRPQTSEEKKPFIARTSAGKAGTAKKGPKTGQSASAPDYGVGDRVRHVNYGDGTVSSLEKGPRDYKVRVQFDTCGQKIMYAGFAKLVKL